VYKSFLLAIFLFSCSDYVESTICRPSNEIQLTDFDTMCSSSVLCTTGNVSEYTRHICFCDIICICFHSKFHLSDSCQSVDDVRCTRNNIIMLFSGNFCKLSKSHRESFMEDVRLQSEQFKEGE